jgi:hypothetical protein
MSLDNNEDEMVGMVPEMENASNHNDEQDEAWNHDDAEQEAVVNEPNDYEEMSVDEVEDDKSMDHEDGGGLEPFRIHQSCASIYDALRSGDNVVSLDWRDLRRGIDFFSSRSQAREPHQDS